MLYLVRHGQSEWNAAGRVQGQTAHPPLTALGRRQARSAAALIAADSAERGDAGPRGLITSDLRRAMQTGAIIAAAIEVDSVRTDRRLREQALGQLQGQSTAAAAALLADVDWSDPHIAVGGGESAHDVYHRMLEALRPLLASERECIVVSHGDAIRLALGALGGYGPANAPWPDIGNGAVFAIEGTSGARALAPRLPSRADSR